VQVLWQNVYNGLQASQEQHAVMLTEAPLNPKQNRAKSAEVFFDTFSVPGLYIQQQPILSLYASGRTSGIVLDSGDGVTTCVPVFEGFVLPHAVGRIDVAGRDITEYLQLLLRKSGHIFHTSSEFEIVRDIKEKICYINMTLESKTEKEDDTEHDPIYKLPDGKTITIGSEKKLAPEVLFNPSLIGQEYVGIHQCLNDSISKCDIDVRKAMYGDIVLAGGSTMFDGFGDRLLIEMRKLAPRDTKIKIFAPLERTTSTWLGGSILASLTTFKKMWITKKEWDEAGASVVFRKTLL